jgi:hypothetical protein
MSCNCKNNVNIDQVLEGNKGPSLPTGETIIKYTLKVLAFILFVLMLPILNVYIIWLIFKTLVLNESVDIMPLLMKIGKKFKDIENDDDDDEIFVGDEYNSYTEDDVVMLDAVDITDEEKDN